MFLLAGVLVAIHLGSGGPQEQHLRVVLGAAAPDITGVGLQYVGKDDEVVRDVHFAFAKGTAPRILSHEQKLPNGEYRIQIDVDARDVRRAVQRRVTLGGGSTQLDVSNALSREDNPLPP